MKGKLESNPRGDKFTSKRKYKNKLSLGGDESLGLKIKKMKGGNKLNGTI